MKKKLLLFTLPILTISLAGCSLFDFYGTSKSSSSEDRWNPTSSSRQTSTIIPLKEDFDAHTYKTDVEKTTLNGTYKQLAENNIYDIDAMPTTNPRVLVLPIWFNDSAYCLTTKGKQQIPEDLNKTFFGTNEETGWYSVSSFFEAESYGKCKITGEVADWYTVNTTAYNLDYDQSNVPQTIEIVKSAVEAWKDTTTEENIKSFDSDNNGYIDQVVVIYGFCNYNNVNDYYLMPRRNKDVARNNSTLWAFTYWMQDNGEDANINNPNVNTFTFASYDFMYENQPTISYDAHTYIHEMGHAFGLEDYYDSSTYSTHSYAGGFSMQDLNIGGHDPHSMIGLGWVNPYVIEEDSEIILKPFESDGDVILLPSGNDKNTFDEYILIEFYSPTGVNYQDSNYSYCNYYPKGPKYQGIRIWHVDARLITPSGLNKGTYSFSESTVVNSIGNNKYGYMFVNTNNTFVPNEGVSVSPLSDYRDYHILELIRNGDYYCNGSANKITYSDLFFQGDTFSIGNYAGYFKNSGHFNNGSTRDWGIQVKSISDNQATIRVVKL